MYGIYKTNTIYNMFFNNDTLNERKTVIFKSKCNTFDVLRDEIL